MPYIIEQISHLSTGELAEALHKDDANLVVIDVRELEEYEEAHIPGLPLISMGDIVDCAEQLDKSKEYVFVCRSGRRSFEVAKYFSSLGFGTVHNYAGGMLDWRGQGLETAAGPENVIDITDIQRQTLRRSDTK